MTRAKHDAPGFDILGVSALSERNLGPVSVPSSIDLSPRFPKVYDQGKLGSCVANAWVGAIMFESTNRGYTTVEKANNDDLHSRLYLYWQARALLNRVDTDSGITNIEAAKALSENGICHESLWPYNVSTFKNPPTPEMSADAEDFKHNGFTYSKLNLDYRCTANESEDLSSYFLCHGIFCNHIDTLKSVLGTNSPVLLGSVLFRSFPLLTSTGIVPMPQWPDEIVGSHGVVIVGYDDKKEMADGSLGGFKFRNSWGPKWGENGYGWFSYRYVKNACFVGDFWKIGPLSQISDQASASPIAKNLSPFCDICNKEELIDITPLDMFSKHTICWMYCG